MDTYGISRAAYEELRAFCLQYDEKRSRLSEVSFLGGVSYESTPVSHGISQPTENLAERLARLNADVEMIDDAAHEAAPGWEAFVIQSVTRNVPFWKLKLDKNLTIGDNSFHAMRRKFFYVLAKKRGMV